MNNVIIHTNSGLLDLDYLSNNVAWPLSEIPYMIGINLLHFSSVKKMLNLLIFISKNKVEF